MLLSAASLAAAAPSRGATASKDSDYDLPVPLPSTAAAAAREPVAVDPAKQQTLVEMWERGVIDKGTHEWEPEDLRLLDKMHEAERLRAFDVLRDKAGTLRGFAVHAPGSAHQTLWLTKAGYNQYFFLKSQQARKFFEQKGTDAKWVFGVRDAKGKKIFDVSGMLTKNGDDLFTRILLGLPAEWRTPDGQTRSNVRPKRAAPAPVP